MKTIRNFVLAFLAVLSLPSFAVQPIYRDVFESGYANWSWAVTDCNNTAYIYEGTKSCYAYYPNAWNGFFAGNYATISTAGYDAVCFAVMALNSPVNAANVIVKFKDQNQTDIGNGISLYSYVPYSSSQGGAFLNPNVWRRVCVPLLWLQAKNRQIGGVMILSSVGNTSLMIDDLKLAYTGFETVGTFYSDGPGLSVVDESWANVHDSQWAPAALSSSPFIYRGLQSYRAYFSGAWEGVKLKNTSGVTTSDKRYLTFWMNSPNGLNLQDIVVQVRGFGDVVIGSQDLGNLNLGFGSYVWVPVTLDLTTLLGSNYGQLIESIVFLSQTSGVGEVYFDDIKVGKGFLSFPLRCSDAACSIDYTEYGAYTADAINTVLDHSMALNSNGYYPYGKVSDGGGNGYITAFNSESVSGVLSGGVCVGGTIYIHPDWNPSKRMTNDNGCGPGYASYDEHPGYDYKASAGAPVYAAATGTVLSTTCYIGNTGGGTCSDWGAVGIDHGNGYVTQYFHMNSTLVSAGQTVFAGQQIGTVGTKCYGCTIGAHLHFEVRRNGPTIGSETKPIVDPYGWVGGGADPLYSSSFVTPVNLWQ